MERTFNLKINKLPESKLRMITRPENTKILTKVDLSKSKNMPPVYDQGSLGSCTACALLAAYDYIKPENFMGSRLFLYYNSRMVENDVENDSGAYLFDGVKCLEKYGVCPEKMYPYIIKKFNKPPPASVYLAALKNKVLKAYNIKNTLESMKRELSAGNPFVVGIYVYKAFLSGQVAKTGAVPMPGPKERPLGGHAVLVVGYDDSTSQFILRNSWGKGWGINGSGYFYLPYAFLSDPTQSTDLWVITAVT